MLHLCKNSIEKIPSLIFFGTLNSCVKIKICWLKNPEMDVNNLTIENWAHRRDRWSADDLIVPRKQQSSSWFGQYDLIWPCQMGPNQIVESALFRVQVLGWLSTFPVALFYWLWFSWIVDEILWNWSFTTKGIKTDNLANIGKLSYDHFWDLFHLTFYFNYLKIYLK